MRVSVDDIVSFSFLYLFICSCKFVIIETRTSDMVHNENVMNTKVNIRVRSKAATSVLPQKLLLFCNIHTEMIVLESLLINNFKATLLKRGSNIGVLL